MNARGFFPPGVRRSSQLDFVNEIVAPESLKILQKKGAVNSSKILLAEERCLAVGVKVAIVVVAVVE